MFFPKSHILDQYWGKNFFFRLGLDERLDIPPNSTKKIQKVEFLIHAQYQKSNIIGFLPLKSWVFHANSQKNFHFFTKSFFNGMVRQTTLKYPL
jgi:hypothetical protein